MDYNEAVNFLKRSLIYQMSLGSKELFHSNIWAWLMQTDKNFIKVFIDSFDTSNYKNEDSICVKREEKSRDILIWLKDNNGEERHIVIENKIKTLPTIDQLEKYTVNLGNSLFYQGVLTGIGECILDLENLKGVNRTSGKWSYVEYSVISERILKIARQSQSDLIKIHFQQIEEYCLILKCINLILDNNIKKHENYLTFDCDYKNLSDLRIADVFKKHKASEFIIFIKKHKEELLKLKPIGYALKISQSFNNGNATLDIRFSNWVNNETPYSLIGIQIEGNQFRVVAERNANVDYISSDYIYENLKNEWFDDDYDKNMNKSIFGKRTSMKPRNGKKYDSYNTGKYCFVYQYFDLGNIEKDYESLFGLINFFISKASLLLKNKQSNPFFV